MEIGTLSSGGQISIPKALRKKFGLKSRSKVMFLERNGEIIIRPLDKSYFKQFIGILKEGEDIIQGLMEEKAKEKKRDELRYL